MSDTLEVFFNANIVYKSEVLLAARADPRYRYPAHELINLGFGFRHPDGNWTAVAVRAQPDQGARADCLPRQHLRGQADGGIRAWPVSGLTARVVGVRVGFDF